MPGPDNYVAEGLVHHNSGKSFSARPVAAPYILDPNARIFVANGKGDAAWEPLRNLSVTYIRGSRPEHAWQLNTVLDQVKDEMERRYDTAERSKVQAGGSLHPWLIIIDEVQEYFGSTEPTTITVGTRKNALLGLVLQYKVASLARLCRAAGIVLMVLTQRPDDTAVPKFVRDQFGTRFANRTTNGGGSEKILGIKPAAATDASKIPARYQGLGLLVPDGEKIRVEGTPLCRPGFIDDDDWERLGRRGYDLRRRAGTAGYLRLSEKDALPLPELLQAILQQVEGLNDDARVSSRALREHLAPGMTETAFGRQLRDWGCPSGRDNGKQAMGPKVGEIRAVAQRIREGGRVEVL